MASKKLMAIAASVVLVIVVLAVVFRVPKLKSTITGS